MNKRIIICALLAATTISAGAQTKAKLEQVEQQKRQLSFKTVTPEEVRSDFNKGGLAGTHPRILTTRTEIERFKQLLKQGDSLAVKTWRQTKKTADENLVKPLAGGDLDAAKLRVVGVHANAVTLPPLVIAWWISGERKYAEQAFKIYQNMCTYNDWGTMVAAPYTDRHYLDTGIAAFDVMLIYDGLYDFLSAQQRDYVYETACKYLFTPTVAQYDGSAKKTWNWNKSNNNWNGICNGGVIMASMSMMERDPKTMSWLISKAINDMPLYLREFEPDGQSEEGLMYWGYGLMYTTASLDAMQRTLNTTYGRAETPGLSKAGYFPLLSTGPVVSLSIGDDPLKNKRSNSLFWFAKHFKDPSLARLQYDLLMENGGVMPWMDIFCYDPELVKKGQKLNVALDNYLYGLELFSLLERWGDRNALFVAMHGGYNSAGHGHLDAGSFDIQALGEVWAYGCLGSDNYTYPGYFSKRTLPDYFGTEEPQTEAGRWHFYRMRAEGKNCLVFNPDTRHDQYEKGRAGMTDSSSTAEKGHFTLDLTDCYQRDAQQYERTIELNRSLKTITIEDRFKTKQPSTVWWSMHTKADISIADDGKTATLLQNGKRMNLKIESQGNMQFTELPASYLPGQSFPHTKNTPNKDMRKLAIKMEGVSAQCLRVNCSFTN